MPVTARHRHAVGPTPESAGSLMELSQGQGADHAARRGNPHVLADGDELALHARAEREAFASIGFGPCIGRIEPARPEWA
jgi:fumarylacetoacetase